VPTVATANAGISTAVKKRNAKISMRLRRGRPGDCPPATDMLSLFICASLFGIAESNGIKGRYLRKP
jgi:hypothetical protein